MHEPGRLLAQGRAADVFEYEDGLVLRRYRTQHSSTEEAAVMRHVRSHDFPVPDVVEASGGDMVMERVDGPTMLADLGAKPWRLFAHANTLADLVRRLHDVPLPPWLEPGPAIIHGDIHPDNVILGPHGPVVIDWSNARAGHPDAEVAELWLLLSIASVPGKGLVPKVLSAGRKLFVRRFLRHFDRDEVRKHVRTAGEWRLRDPNMGDDERERIRGFVARWAI